MTLWLLKAKQEFTGYTKNQDIVVRAETEKRAREIASIADCDDRWDDPEYASCGILEHDGTEGVVIVNNNGG